MLFASFDYILDCEVEELQGLSKFSRLTMIKTRDYFLFVTLSSEHINFILFFA